MTHTQLNTPVLILHGGNTHPQLNITHINNRGELVTPKVAKPGTVFFTDYKMWVSARQSHPTARYYRQISGSNLIYVLEPASQRCLTSMLCGY